METVIRGFVPSDKEEFGDSVREKMNAAADELCFLLNRGYNIKSAATFIGNHYLLSLRQRQALVRITASDDILRKRALKEFAEPPERLWIDGFNTIITLEVALSGSLLLKGMDGCIRDLAGLRGAYRIVDKTAKAVELLTSWLKRKSVPEAAIYLDKQVSNSGRLREILLQTARNRGLSLCAELYPDVDRLLSLKASVVTSDSIVLDRCGGWYNLNRYLIDEEIPNAWIFSLN